MQIVLVLLAAAGAGLAAGALAARVSAMPWGRGVMFLRRAVTLGGGGGALGRAPDGGVARLSALGALAGAVALAGLGWAALGAGVLAGAAAGPGLSFGWRWARRKAERVRRLRALVLLHEVVDLHVQAGYSLQEALAAAAECVPEYAPQLERCLRRWPQGPARALLLLGEELGVEGAEVLAAVLQGVLEAGEGRLAGALAEEGGVLARLEELAAEEQVGLRPLYQTLYLALPGLAVSGLMAVPLLYRVVERITAVRAGY